MKKQKQEETDWSEVIGYVAIGLFVMGVLATAAFLFVALAIFQPGPRTEPAKERPPNTSSPKEVRIGTVAVRITHAQGIENDRRTKCAIFLSVRNNHETRIYRHAPRSSWLNRDEKLAKVRDDLGNQLALDSLGLLYPPHGLSVDREIQVPPGEERPDAVLLKDFPIKQAKHLVVTLAIADPETGKKQDVEFTVPVEMIEKPADR